MRWVPSGRGLRAAPRWRVWSALTAVYLIWGSTYVAVAFAIEYVPPLVQGGFRYVTAGLILFALLAGFRGRSSIRVTRSELTTAAIGGLLLLLGGNGLVAVGQQGLTSSMAALLVATMPLWLILLRAAFGDRPALASGAGVLIGLVGVAIL